MRAREREREREGEEKKKKKGEKDTHPMWSKKNKYFFRTASRITRHPPTFNQLNKFIVLTSIIIYDLV